MTLFAPAVNTPNFVSVGLRRNDRFERPGVGRPISSPGSGWASQIPEPTSVTKNPCERLSS